MDDANNQVLEWRKLDAPIPPEVWESGYWLYGLRGQYHSKGGWSKYFPTHLNMTATGEWWAPVNADGTPRPWPELEAGIKKKTVASPVAPQAAPRPGTVDVWPLVIEDMRRRDADGRRQYGTPLQAHNGRDALVDAYHEALDLAVYLRQEIVQREDAAAEIAALQADNDRLRVKIACASDLANLAASDDQVRRDSEVHTAHALVYLRIARAASDDQDYWIRLARESREHAREARKEERPF